MAARLLAPAGAAARATEQTALNATMLLITRMLLRRAWARSASWTLVHLEAADVMNDSLDLLVVEGVPERRHGAFLAVLAAGGYEGVAALRAREHGTLAGGTAAILMAKSAG